MKTSITRPGDAALRRARLSVLIALLLPSLGMAATFNVTTTSDSGAGSLRDAIDQANRTAGADTVTFAANVTGTITLTGGAIDVLDAVRVVGPGAQRLSISGNNVSRIFRVDPAVDEEVIAVGISGLSFINGHSDDEGGAIFANDSDLTIESSTFRSNSATRGGALYVFPAMSTTLTLRDTRFESNTAVSDGGGFGAQDIDQVTLQNIVVIDNTASRNGGGAYLRAVRVDVNGSEFSDNLSSQLPPSQTGITGGGGLRIDGSKATAATTITATRFVNNTATQGQGGALWVTAREPQSLPIIATATLERVQATGNGASLTGGAISAAFVNTTLRNSAVAGNTTQSSGGGIACQDGGSLQLVNSTVAGNTSVTANGGGIYSAAETSLGVMSSTVVGNSANNGGGILRTGGGATLNNSIVANNNAPAAPDINGSFSANYTLVKNASGATLSSGSGNLAAGIDPLLGALGVNGGPTLSLLPAVGSPVLNAGDPAGTGLASGDQRELPRISGGRVDIGAIERQTPEDVIFRNGLQ